MQIEWINHASFIVNSGSVRLIADPWLFGRAFNESWELFVPSKFTADDFDSVTHIWFSHEHPDHFSPPVLSGSPRKPESRLASFSKKQETIG